MIELKEVTKTYGDSTAVDRLSLRVERGEIFGFIGPNGAGKTTTIKLIGGVLEPSSGTVEVGGLDLSNHPEAAKRKIGFIPDRPYLYEKLTALEFLRFTADVYGVPQTRFNDDAHRNLELFSLSDYSDDLIESYSHGMKQRLIMAAALLHRPEVIVVDEPMVGLDPVAIMMVKELFSQMAREGTTIFMSTHTLKVAEDICHRIGVINKGHLVACGTAAELQRKTNSGDSNLEAIFLNLTQRGFNARPSSL
jgi:ABC-2 type transport system ATP-binding protein